MDSSYYYFSNTWDEDYQAGYYVIVFSALEKYIINEQTHGLIGHSIKHLMDFDHESVDKAILLIREIILNQGFVFLMDCGGNIIAEGADAKNKISNTAIINTMDLVNDKLAVNQALYPIEIEIAAIVRQLGDQYLKLAAEHISNSLAFPGINKMKLLIQKNITIKVTGSINGFRNHYYLNFLNTGLLVQDIKNPRHLITFFRIDKKGSSLARIAKFFSKVELEDRDLAAYFEGIR